MKQKKILFFASVILTLLCLSTLTFAQGTGKISGRVTDAQSGDYLPGANVILEGTTIGAASNREGKYRIVNVPAGTYTLMVKYMGYQDYSEKITVTAGKNTLIDIALKVSYVKMEDVVVSGIRQGQVKALEMQKEAPNILNVVSREQMENFPDVNAAEVLQRLPGVTVDRSQGDGRYVLIRGTSPRLSTVTVNGDALASTRNEERFSQLDIVGTNQMSYIEVAKTLTPDMDANFIGGRVNIITRSAFDFPSRHLDLTVGSGYAELDKKANWQGKLNYSDQFGANKNFGFSVTANYDRKNRGADNIEYEWDSQKDVNDNEIPYALTDFTLFDYQLIKERYGIGAGLEYRFNDNNRIYVNGMMNKFKDISQNGRLRFRVSKGDYLNPDGTLIENARIVRLTKGRTENLTQNQLTFGGKHLLGDNKLDYLLSYSFGEETHPNQTDSEFDLDKKVNLSLDLSDPVTPKWKILNQDAGYENIASHYEFASTDYRETYSSTINRAASINFNMPYNLWKNTSNFKIGGKFTSLTKDRNDDRSKYKWKGDNDLLMSQWLSDRQRNDFFNDSYTFGEQANWDDYKAFFDANRDKDGKLIGSPNIEDSKGASYKIDESVLAFYAMTDINFGKLYMLLGLRDELTNNELQGYKLIFDADGDFSSLEQVDQTKDYNKLFPMLHLNYSFAQSTKLRFAATQSMSRPNFWDMAPHLYVDNRKERIKSGNPDLVPTTSTNIDLMFDHYFHGIGIFSTGLFYKDLKDIIFETRTKVQSGQYVGYDLRTTVNGGNANLYGLEINWQQELTFLPGFLSGFGIYLNYSHTWSNADLLGRAGVVPGQSGDVGNISLAYEVSRFMARISFNYQGRFIKEVGGTEDGDFWIKDHKQLDLTAYYEFIDNLKLFLEFVNLTNEPKYEYMGVESRPTQVEYYSWWSRIGLKYTL
ncbi:hypothetical protein MNBD_IGNAVI01-2893 [hydrothermal vent metagenome]|uniref:TonB-dependent receptor n=1 Tax=hydrothermal vent metagenome TaxID=652676 RepID=A0A3B1D1X6_9ZZZZ